MITLIDEPLPRLPLKVQHFHGVLKISGRGKPFFKTITEAYQTMLATEDILRKDWDDPEEDAIWADL